MAGPDAFDEALALQVVDSLSDVRRRFEAHCHLLGRDDRPATAWDGPAQAEWRRRLDTCLADGMEVVQALTAAIEDIERRQERWRFEVRRTGGTGR